jgi:hypothetical protein
MQRFNSVGSILAIILLILAIVLAVIGKLPMLEAVLFILAALGILL